MDDKNFMYTNTELKVIFGQDRIAFTDIPKLIDAHLSPIDPIEIHFPIKLLFLN